MNDKRDAKSPPKYNKKGVYMTLCDRLKHLKEKSNLTNQQIADISKVPLSTVNRILAGYTDNPSFSNVCDIIVAMGGSVDEIIGATFPADTSFQCSQHMKYINNTLELYQKNILEYRKWIRILFTALMSLVGIIALLLTIDLLNGKFGLFRY